MRFMNKHDFSMYERAEGHMEYLRRAHAEEVEAAYDNIHPTRSCFDYDTGKIISESINPCDYAIYLIDLQNRHEREKKWWEEKARIYKSAYESLTDEEQQDWEESRSFDVYKKLRDLLMQQIEAEQKSFTDEERLANLEQYIQENKELIEADAEIDKMSMKEIMNEALRKFIC